jgi:hypothetical protein
VFEDLYHSSVVSFVCASRVETDSVVDGVFGGVGRDFSRDEEAREGLRGVWTGAVKVDRFFEAFGGLADGRRGEGMASKWGWGAQEEATIVGGV